MDLKSYMWLTGLTLLTACGSSGSSGGDEVDTTTPQASTGFAVAGQTDRASVTFTIRDVPSYEETGDYSQVVANGGVFVDDETGEETPFTLDTFELGSQDVSIGFNDDESEATLTINGNTYTLTRVIDPEEPDDIIYEFADDTAYVGFSVTPILDFELGADSSVVTAVSGAELTNTGISTFLDVLGFDTNPEAIAATTGEATYEGNLILVGTNINEEGPDDGSETDPDAPTQGFDGIEGALTMTANFDSNTISGNAVLDNDNPEMPLTETLIFESAAITGNGFSGAVTGDGQFFEPGLSLGDVNYDGHFFGAEGESVAGTLSGEVLVEGADPILMLGVYGAEDVTGAP